MKKGQWRSLSVWPRRKKTVRVEDILTDNSSRMIDNFIREKLKESGKGVLEAEQPGKIMLNPEDDHLLNVGNLPIDKIEARNEQVL